MHTDIGMTSTHSSPVQKLDARVKLLLAFITVFAVVLLSHWQTPLIVLAVCFLILLVSHAPIRLYVKRLLYPIYIILFIAAVQPLTYGSTVIAKVPMLPLNIYAEGTAFGLLIFTRCLAAVAVLNLLITLVSLEDLMDSMAWFRVPAVIIDTMTLMYRYISVISEESKRIHRAQESRCGYSENIGFSKKISNYGTLAGMLLTRSFDRAIKVGDAMASRGYSGKSSVFTYTKTSLPSKDAVIGMAAAATVTLLVYADTILL